MKDCDYPRALLMEEGQEVIVGGIRRKITFKMKTEARTGFGMGDGPAYLYFVLDNGEVWMFGEWSEVSYGRLVSVRKKTESSF